MKHLKMYFMRGTEIPSYTLPEGYSFSLYKGKEDITPWIECCKNGLVDDDADEKTFNRRITEHPFTVAQKDLFFLDFNGEHIGTFTVVYHSDDEIGEIHMVGIRTDFRGKGLVKYINAEAIRLLMDRGARYIYLVTMEWREGAVKSYLNAGFLPVEYDDGMPERWQAVIEKYGIDSVNMLNEDGTFYKTLHA